MKEFTFFNLFKSMNYMLELLIGTNIFLWKWPRKKQFKWIFPLVCILDIALSSPFYFLPFTTLFNFLSFFFYLGFMILIFGSMSLCYDVPKTAILSACVGGICLQHIGYHLSVLVAMIPGMNFMDSVFVEEIICALIFIICYFTIGKLVAKNEYYKNFDKRIVIIAVITVLFCIGIIRFQRQACVEGNYDKWMNIAVSLYAITNSILSLFILFFLWRFVSVKSSYFIERRLEEEELKQFKMQMRNNEQLNIKFHDLKHKIQSLEGSLPQKEVQEINKLLKNYDASYQTGIPGLDALLNEKSYYCLKHSIDLTLNGDVKALSFMDQMDIYSLFGNILDNAIEAVNQIQEKEKRVISFIIEKKGDMVYLNEMNYSTGNLNFVDGLLETTKSGEKGYHGFGMKSIRNTAEKYDGLVNVSIKKDLFVLSIALFSPNKKEDKKEEM